MHGYRDGNCLPATCLAMYVHGVCQPPVIITQGMTVGTCSVTSHSQPHLPPKLEFPFLTAKKTNTLCGTLYLHPRTGGQLYIHDRTQLTLHQPWGHVERKEKKNGKQKENTNISNERNAQKKIKRDHVLILLFTSHSSKNKAMQGRRRCGGSCELQFVWKEYVCAFLSRLHASDISFPAENCMHPVTPPKIFRSRADVCFPSSLVVV